MPDPTVRELLLAKVDELVAKVATLLTEIRAVTEHSSRNGPASCRNDLTMADVMVDEIKWRARTRPLAESPQ